MTDAMKEAHRLTNLVRTERGRPPSNLVLRETASIVEAFCRTLEEFDKYRLDVSEAVIKRGYDVTDKDFGKFIVFEKVTDPLVAMMLKHNGPNMEYAKSMADMLRENLAEYGLEVNSKVEPEHQHEWEPVFRNTGKPSTVYLCKTCDKYEYRSEEL